MSKVIPLNEDRDMKPLLLERAEITDTLEGIILIELHKDGSQRLFTSKFNFEQKCFLKCFFDAWVIKWFDRSYDL